MSKKTYSVSLTQNEWNDLLMILHTDDKALAETITEQIDEQIEKEGK